MRTVKRKLPSCDLGSISRHSKQKQRRRMSIFLRCFCPVWVLVRVFQKMQKIGTPDRLLVLTIKIRKSKEKDWKSFDFQS